MNDAPTRGNVNVEEKLSVNKFHVDEQHAHIVLKETMTDDDFAKLILACPAALYKVDDEGKRSFDYAGCLECGTCRVLCGTTGLDTWEYPNGTMGVEYRFG
jgi:ferredoxin-like protein FixX